jgi:hypothetical protein
MSPLANPLALKRALAAALIAVTLAGCGGTSDALSHAVSAAARASNAATRLSPQLMRSWCPQAVAGGGRRLTDAQARGCLQRAWDGWLRELRRNRYDPSRVVTDADGRRDAMPLR